MDKLHINGLEANAVIGVHSWERQLRQRLSIDLVLDTQAAPAAASDNLVDALDYGAVARRVTDLIEASRWQLIETLAEAIASAVLDEFPTPGLTVRVTKPDAVPNAAGVVIQIRRER